MLLTVDLERLDVRPGHRVLDAGCGEGRHCFGAMTRGAEVVGLDLDLDSPACARPRARVIPPETRRRRSTFRLRAKSHMGHTHVSDPETQMVLCVRASPYVFGI